MWPLSLLGRSLSFSLAASGFGGRGGGCRLPRASGGIVGVASCLWKEGRGRCCNNPTVTPHKHTQVCPLRLHAQASQAGNGSWPSSPLEIRLRLAFRGSSASSSTVVSVWVLSPDTLRFLSSLRVGLCGMSTTPWSVGGSLTGGLSKKYFSTGRSLSSGASKRSCLFPVLYSPVRTDKNTEIKI